MLKTAKSMRARAAQHFLEENGFIQVNEHWIGSQIPLLPSDPCVVSREDFVPLSRTSNGDNDAFHLIAAIRPLKFMIHFDTFAL